MYGGKLPGVAGRFTCKDAGWASSSIPKSSMLVRGRKISQLKGLILQRLWGSDLLLKLGGENQKEQKFHAVTFLFLCVIFTQNHHVFTKLSFFKCIISVQLEHTEWLRVLFLLIVDLLLHRKFKNGKFSLSILLDAMSLPSMCALAETAQLCLVFSWWRPAAELCSGLFSGNGSCSPWKKLGYIVGSWKGERSLQ